MLLRTPTQSLTDQLAEIGSTAGTRPASTSGRSSRMKALAWQPGLAMRLAARRRSRLKWSIAAFLATMIAFALSLLLLRKPREATAIAIYEAQQHRRKSPAQLAEEAIEDAQADDVTAQQTEK